MSNAIAKVAFLKGQAWAKGPDGNMRPLTVGSIINEDDILITAQAARVELDVGNADPLVINGGLHVGMSRDLLADTATGSDEALLSDASVREALTVLEQGGDLLEELEETAAGDTGGSGGEGHNFVQLTRLIETTDPQSFTYTEAAPLEQAPTTTQSGYANKAPVVTDQTLSADEDETVNGQIIAQDPEGSAISFTLTIPPVNGAVVLDPVTGQFSFVPAANFSGSDSFVVTVTDGRGNSTTTTVTLNIAPVNDAPTSADISLATDEDVSVSGQIQAQDIEGDTLVYGLSGQPANGSVTLNAATGAFVFTPNADYNGSDAFIVTISDGKGGTTTSKVTIGITPVNDAPTSSDQILTTAEDTDLAGQITATDLDNDSLSYTVTTAPTNGTVLVDQTTGAFVFKPAANYTGSDTFTVTISDGKGGTTTSKVTIGITPANDAPTSSDQILTTAEDTDLAGQITATDLDNDTLSYTVTTAPTNGTVLVDQTTGAFVFKPAANYTGSDTFTVTISDGKGGTTTSKV
ncbi:MAG TPA: retention module-containing protein, partial [Cellvibrio sp.]|nr:retention module-containing protein [Cellvibrio sp.]